MPGVCLQNGKKATMQHPTGQDRGVSEEEKEEAVEEWRCGHVKWSITAFGSSFSAQALPGRFAEHCIFANSLAVTVRVANELDANTDVERAWENRCRAIERCWKTFTKLTRLNGVDARRK